MARRHFHLSDGALFLLLLCIGFGLLVLPSSRTQRINFLFAEIFEPLIRLGRQHPELVPAAGPNEHAVSRRDYDALKTEYNNLHAQLLSLQERFETIAQIRSDLPRFYSGLVVAEVVRPRVGVTHELLINKGADDNVRRGCYVMSTKQNSIIGVVRETSARMARVRLLTDANQNIGIRIRRQGSALDVGAMMFGDGRHGGTVSLVEREKDIRPGDTVYAAPRPGLLDIPMVIGNISDVQPDEESPLLWKIGVRTVENAADLKTVAVIVTETPDASGQ